MRDLDLVLSYLTGRRLTGRDIYTALGMPKATYFAQRDRGRLHQPENLLKLARAFGVNPVDLLVEYGHLTAGDVASYRADAVAAPGPSLTKATIVSVDEIRAVDTAAPSTAEQRHVLLELPANIPMEATEKLVEALNRAIDSVQDGKAIETS